MSNSFYKPKTLFTLISLILLLNGCSSSSAITNISEVHPYDSSFGVLENREVDAIIQEEVQNQNQSAEVDYSSVDGQYTTQIERSPDEFLEEEWIQPEPIITYKYQDDTKFYREDELPENKFKLGKVIVKIPAGMDKSKFLAQLEE